MLILYHVRVNFRQGIFRFGSVIPPTSYAAAVRDRLFFSDFGTPEKKPEKTPESKKIPNTPEFFAALRAAFSILL